jgi:hypothetical protein
MTSETIVDQLVVELTYRISEESEKTLEKFQSMFSSNGELNEKMNTIRVKLPQMGKIYPNFWPKLPYRIILRDKSDDSNKENKEENRLKKLQKMEEDKNKAIVKNSKDTTITVKKLFSSLGYATRGLFGLTIARRIARDFSSMLPIGENTAVNAMMSNMSIPKTEAVTEFFKKLGIDVDQGFKTLWSYANFYKIQNQPSDKILQRMINESKTGSFQAAVSNGADPATLRKLKNYQGNLSKDLQNLLQNPLFTEKDLKNMEEIQQKFSNIYERLKFFGFKIIQPFANVILWLGEFADKIENVFSSNFGKMFDNFKNTLTSNNYKMPLSSTSPSPYFGDTPINIVNNFDIKSTEPQEISREIETNMSSQFYRDMIYHVRPNTVK